MRLRGTSALCYIALLLLNATPIHAWSNPGHGQVAQIAWGQLDDETRAKVVRILREHEHFQNDFWRNMPRSIKNGDSSLQDHWIFLQAAIWPDLVRKHGGRRFAGPDLIRLHRPTWHYINNPLYLDESQRKALEGTLPDDLDRDLEDCDHETRCDLNAAQAWKLAIHKIEETTVPDSEKARYLCWLFHLVGDIHQPLHAAELYTVRALPGGDNGGNLIQTPKGVNLHARWDQLPGTTRQGEWTSLDRVTAAVERLTADAALVSAGHDAATNLSFEDWMDESYELAREHVYTAEIMGAIRDAEYDERPVPEIVVRRLSADYDRNAKKVCDKRVVEAGYRLAAVIKGLDL